MATLESGYRFGELPDGWTINEGGTATYAVAFTDPGDCKVAAVPVDPTVTQATCSGPGSASDPSVTTAVTEGIDGQGVRRQRPRDGHARSPATGSASCRTGGRSTRVGPRPTRSRSPAPAPASWASRRASVVTAGTCEADGTLTLPTTEHVTYVVEPVIDGAGTYTVTATADKGYTIVGESTGC